MLGVQSLGPMRDLRAAPKRVAEGDFDALDPVARPPEAAPAAGAEACMPGPARPPVVRSLDSRDPEREAWVILLTAPGLGPVTFARLLGAFGTARGVLAAAGGWAAERQIGHALGPAAELAAGRGRDDIRAPQNDEDLAMSAELARRLADHVAGAETILRSVRAHGLQVVTLDDGEYPERLRQVDMPPPLLFVRGDVASLSAPSAVAVVGTRSPTDRGRKIACWIGSALAQAGAVVVSGLAVGIDGVAHAAVVAEGRPTVAVLGGGHAHLFPRAHERLADEIVAAGGAVVAELPPDTPATRGTFPRRNRVVSGLSDATVVVEAGRRSGALITAGWALEQGRACFLVPGPMDSAASEGCHLFLRSFAGEARLVAGIPELLEDLELAGVAKDEAPVRGSRPESSARGAGPAGVLAALGPVERSVAERLKEGPATADELAALVRLPSATVLSVLTMLELKGLVTGAYGRYMAAGALARWPGKPVG